MFPIRMIQQGPGEYLENRILQQLGKEECFSSVTKSFRNYGTFSYTEIYMLHFYKQFIESSPSIFLEFEPWEERGELSSTSLSAHPCNLPF